MESSVGQIEGLICLKPFWGKLASGFWAGRGIFMHLDELMFKVMVAKFSDEVEKNLVEWQEKSAKIWCGFTALWEAEFMSSRRQYHGGVPQESARWRRIVSVTDSVADSVGLAEKPKSSTKMILCSIWEALLVAIFMHCDDGWFTMMEAEC
ncbi:hypothetical protein POTOM_055040 [Populus tomentosa]|uniref:Uncharacterized protein n=1 Tax=Populus tomentosa TaxID=118781 RepID=A0A8X7XZU9_POPTO|nr:hypothetical protein POTOM_055040 [Populus tomentosa]